MARSTYWTSRPWPRAGVGLIRPWTWMRMVMWTSWTHSGWPDDGVWAAGKGDLGAGETGYQPWGMPSGCWA